MHGGRVGKGEEGAHLVILVTHEIGLSVLQGGAAGVADHFQIDLAHAAVVHVDLLGGSIGKVDDAATHVGAAVGHADHDALAVALVGDAHHGADGQGAVGSREGVHVIAFTAGGLLVVEVGPVPGGHAGHEGIGVALGTFEPDITAGGSSLCIAGIGGGHGGGQQQTGQQQRRHPHGRM